MGRATLLLRQDAERLWATRDVRKPGGLQPSDHPSRRPTASSGPRRPDVVEEPSAAPQQAPQLAVERLAVESARDCDHRRIMEDACEAAILQRGQDLHRVTD